MRRRELLAAGLTLASAGGSGPALAQQQAQQQAQSEPVRVALISPTTGALAAFGVTNTYVHQLFAERLAAGIPTRSLGQRPVLLELHDAGSTPTQAAAAARAAADQGAHLVLASATPEVCNPVSDVCEAVGLPCVTTVVPWQAWFYGRKGERNRGFQWTYHFFVGLEDFASIYSSLFARARLGELVGGLWPDDIDGEAFLSVMPQAMAQEGLRLVDPGRLQMAAPDYTGIATRLRDAGVQMVTGVLPPPVALEFFAAARKVGYQPRMASIAKAFPFPETVAELQSSGMALANEVWWSPAWPFRSGWTDASAAQVVQEYESRTKRPWVQTLGFSHALVDLAVQLVQETPTLSRQALVQTLRRIKAKTVLGPLSFSGRFPSLNVCSVPAVGGLWQRDAQGRWTLEVVDNARSSFIPVTTRLPQGLG